MRHLGLKVRMLLAGSILFGFYMLVATVLLFYFGLQFWPLVLLGILVLPVVQYTFGKWAAVRSVGAEDMPEDGDFRRIHQRTEELSRSMDIEKPRLMVASMGTPNAFATGRRGAGVVVVSTELLQVLDDRELDGVIAHELAHIRNRDVITMVLGQSIAMLVGYLAYFAILFGGQRNIGTWILALVASQVASMIVIVFVMAISRYREYVADDDAREAIGTGEPLARALEKIAVVSENRESTVDDSMAALCIFNREQGLLQSLFATHPPAEKRIERLRN